MNDGERYYTPLQKTFLKLQGTSGMKELDKEAEENPRGPGRPRKTPKNLAGNRTR